MKSLEELRVIRERMQGTVAYRSEHESLEEAVASEHGKYRTHVLVCGGTGCTSSGSQKIRERLDEDPEERTGRGSMCDQDRLFWSVCAGTDHDCVSGGRVLFYGQGRRHS